MGWFGFVLGGWLVRFGEWFFDVSAKLGWDMVKRFGTEAQYRRFELERHSALMDQLKSLRGEAAEYMAKHAPSASPLPPTSSGTVN